MKLNHGYPLRTVNREEYFDDRDQALNFEELIEGSEYTARLIISPICTQDYAADYPVELQKIIYPTRRLIMLSPAVAKVALLP